MKTTNKRIEEESIKYAESQYQILYYDQNIKAFEKGANFGLSLAFEWMNAEDNPPVGYMNVIVQISIRSIRNNSGCVMVGIAMFIPDKNEWSGLIIDHLKQGCSDDFGVHSTWKVMNWRYINFRI